MSIQNLGGLLQLGGNLLYNNWANKKKEEQLNLTNQQFDKQEQVIDGMFNSQYYENYMNRADVQAALNEFKKQMEQQTKNAQNTAVVTGATPESLVAGQQAQADALGDVIGNITSQGAAYKDNLRKEYLNNKLLLNDKRYNALLNSSNLFNSNLDKMTGIFGAGLASLFPKNEKESNALDSSNLQ